MHVARETNDEREHVHLDVLLTIVPTEREDEATQVDEDRRPSPSLARPEDLDAPPPINATITEIIEIPPEPAPNPTPAAAPAAIPAATAAPTSTPAPARRGTGLIVAASVGGGAVLGGGVVAVLAAMGLVVLLLLGGVGTMVWLRSAAPVVAEAPTVAPPAAETPATEAVAPVAVVPVDGQAAAPSAPAAPSASAEAPAGAPAATSGTPSAAVPTPEPVVVPSVASPAAPAAQNPAPAAPNPVPAAPASGTPAAAPAPVQAKPAAAPAAPAGNVLVKIITDPPAARIVVDGDDRGRTPSKLELAPGSHQIVLESGKSTDTFTIEAAPGTERFCFAQSGKKLAQVPCN